MFSDCSLARPSLPLLLLASVQSCLLFLKSLPISMFFLFLFLFYCLDCICSICTLKNCVNCEIFFINLYYSFGAYNFIKGVDLIGTESKALWSLCLLHLSVCLCQSVQLPLHFTRPLACSVCQISLQFSWQTLE